MQKTLSFLTRTKKLFFLVLFFFNGYSSFSQDWVKHSDSIYSNILKNDTKKAKEFLDLTEKEIRKTTIVKDTLYADFLYRKGLVHYFNKEESLQYLNESLKIWESSKKKNPYKLMKIHYFLGENYYYKKKDYVSAYSQYEKCYQINKNNNFKNQ